MRRSLASVRARLGHSTRHRPACSTHACSSCLRECAEEGNIRRDPCFIKHEKRAALYFALGLVIDATKYRSSIGDDKFISLIFWSERIRWHLAPALSKPRNTVEDRTACCWEYDIAKARVSVSLGSPCVSRCRECGL